MGDHWTVRVQPEGVDDRIDLPDEVLAKLGVTIGDEVEVEARDGVIVVTPIKKP